MPSPNSSRGSNPDPSHRAHSSTEFDLQITLHTLQHPSHLFNHFLAAWEGSLVSISGSPGRLLPHLYTLIPSGSVEICGRGVEVAVQSPSLRSVFCPSSVQKNNGGSGSTPQDSRNSGFLIYRLLAWE